MFNNFKITVMKKKDFLWSLLAFVMAATLSVGFSSCGGDDDDDSGNNNKEIDNKEIDNSPADAVDLGLSVKWASCNVGATKDSEVGNFYLWGETETKDYYYDDSYTLDETSLPRNIANTQYDVAHVKWGGKWRMPTETELRELISCESRKVTRNGREGYMFYGKNGNTIFLPATGMAYKSEIRDDGVEGWYWSSTNDDGMIPALTFDFDYNEGPHIYEILTTRGAVVRPVCGY